MNIITKNKEINGYLDKSQPTKQWACSEIIESVKKKFALVVIQTLNGSYSAKQPFKICGPCKLLFEHRNWPN